MRPARTKRRDMRPRGPKSSWEGVSDWYAGYMGKGGEFQNELVFPGAIRLLKPRVDGAYLDLACGQGAFTRLLAQEAKRGTVWGLDASPSLINVAKKGAPKHVRFVVEDARAFAKLIKPASLDGIVCNLAIQNIDPIGPVFADAARVLKTNGVFVITMNHPSFRQPRQSGWGWDEERKLQYRRVDKYLGEYEMPIIAHPGSAPHVKTYSYHRPLSTYVNELAKHGFMIAALEEWASHKHSDSGPKARAENLARKEIPLFLALRAIKL